MNKATVEVSTILKIEDSKLYIVDGKNDTVDLLNRIFASQTVDLVICTSIGHLNACLEIAELFNNSNTIKTKFLVRVSGDLIKSYNNLFRFTYNYGTVNYFAGYFAGLYTKTKKIGFIQSTKQNNSYTYSFWLGAMDANRNVTVNIYQIGTFINVDKTVGAANSLLDMGCDVIGDTMDDFSTGKTLISRNIKALGTNGFPQKSVYGENVAFGYVYNWTKIFYPLVNKTMYGINITEDTYGEMTYNTSLDMFHFEYSETVIGYKDIQSEMKKRETIFRNQNRTTFPMNCNSYIYDYATRHNFSMDKITYENGSIHCFNISYLYYPKPLDFPGMNYLGIYNISNVQVFFSHSMRQGISISSGFLIALVLVLMIGVFKHGETDSIISASPVFLNFILLGAITVYVGIIVWVSDLNTAACNARLWLLTLGFSMVIGSLVVKNLRIWFIFDNPGLKTVEIRNYHLYPFVAACLIINIILMSILSSIGDLREIDEQGIDNLGKYEYLKICKMNSSGAYTLYTILAYFGVLLLIGLLVSWKIRIVDIEDLNESRVIANTLYTIGFCVFVIVPLLISPQDKQSETIIICVAALFIVTSAILIIFIPKFYRIYGFGNTAMVFKSSNDNNSNFIKNQIPDNDDLAKSVDSNKSANNNIQVFSDSQVIEKPNVNVLADFTDSDHSESDV